MTKARSMQKVKVRSQWSMSQRSKPNLTVSGPLLQFEFMCCLGEVLYCFSRSSIKFQGYMAKKIVYLDSNWAFSDCNFSLIHQWIRNDAQSLNNIEEVPYCFSKSYVKLQGHTGQKIVHFDPNWAFPDCNLSLNSPMALKWCTKFNVA